MSFFNVYINMYLPRIICVSLIKEKHFELYAIHVLIYMIHLKISGN